MAPAYLTEPIRNRDRAARGWGNGHSVAAYCLQSQLNANGYNVATRAHERLSPTHHGRDWPFGRPVRVPLRRRVPAWLGCPADRTEAARLRPPSRAAGPELASAQTAKYHDRVAADAAEAKPLLWPRPVRFPPLARLCVSGCSVFCISHHAGGCCLAHPTPPLSDSCPPGPGAECFV